MKKYTTPKNHVKLIRDFLLDLLFPVQCLVCAQAQNNKYLCDNCKDKIIVNRKFSCAKCKTPSNLGSYCPSCQTKNELDGLWIISDYRNKTLAKLIKKFKYSFNKNIAPTLSNLMISFIEQNKIQEKSKLFKNPEDLIIVPVPLHKNKLRLRGFNQSEELAILIAKELKIKLNAKNLIRHKNTKAQAKLHREERLKNVQNAFTWTGNTLKNKNIILVDDVSSTGATLDNSTKVLKENGANTVWGLVLAKN